MTPLVNKNVNSLIKSSNNSSKSGSLTNLCNNMENLRIENAAYFLSKEHMIYLSHVESCEKLYIRLISDNQLVILS